VEEEFFLPFRANVNVANTNVKYNTFRKKIENLQELGLNKPEVLRDLTSKVHSLKRKNDK